MGPSPARDAIARPGLLRSHPAEDQVAPVPTRLGGTGLGLGYAALTVLGAAPEGDPAPYTVVQLPWEGWVRLAGPPPITE